MLLLTKKILKHNLMSIDYKYHLRNYKNVLFTTLRYILSRYEQKDISIFHNFSPSPAGGGNQFLRALSQEIKKTNYRLEYNSISPTTKACLFNSYNFDFQRLKKFYNQNCVMVHRVDGPISVYRGIDHNIDNQIHEINKKIAQATIFQSRYSLEKHLEMGLNFINPTIISNAVDPTIFHSDNRIEFSTQRKIRLISSSWSDNPNKGDSIYIWLDQNLNWNEYEYTFAGRTKIQFKNIHHQSPVNSFLLAGLLRNHDIYITASKNDACSNSLIEALACGLPAIFLNSGGNPEIVGKGGIGFDHPEEIPQMLSLLIKKYSFFQNKIKIPSIRAVTLAYLHVMGFAFGNR